MAARSVCGLGVLLALSALACSDESGAKCQDRDGDGRGSGCAQGPDCDDADPTRASLCGDAAVPDCEADPLARGCPCLGSEHSECFPAAAISSGTGVCRIGTTRCENGSWSECEGAVLPDFERCNTLDDDCDGIVDEGVESPCGGCNAECMGGVWGPPSAPFDVSSPLAVNVFDELTLERVEQSALTLWVPNTDEGTVSKIDTASAREVARYRTRGQSPIRAAVDQRGDAWVLDGSKSGSAHLTKIAGLRSRCRGLESSAGPDDVRALGQDACVLLDLPLGAAGDDARALALDAAPAPDSERAGNVWIGLAAARRLIALDGDSGAQLLSLELGDFSAYAGTFDEDGVLWLIDRAGYLARVDPARVPPALELHSVPFACYALEALSIDASGRLLLTGFGCESLISFDPRRNTWRQTQVPSLLSPRGAATLSGFSWIAYTSGQIARVGGNPLAIGPAQSLAMQELQPFETIALAGDSLGQLWAISTQGGPNGRGLASRFDPERALVTAQIPVGVGPRGSGDLSGLEHAYASAAEGQASHVFMGCDRAVDEHAPQSLTRWGALHVASVIGAYASVDVEIRQADSPDALEGRAYRRLATLPRDSSDIALTLPDGGVVEVRLTLRSQAAIGAPRIGRIGVEWTCYGPD